MEFIKWLILISFFGSLQAVYRNSTRHKRHVFLTETEALSFTHQRRKRTTHDSLKNDAAAECCSEDCYFEERAEHESVFPADKPGGILCELSIREGRACTCYKPDQITAYECGSTDMKPGGSCENPCKAGMFYCGYDRKCVDMNKKCDSKKDCDGWQDETECSILRHHNVEAIAKGTKLKVNGKDKKYFGDVFVLDRPVCDEFWDSRAAKITCESMGLSRDVRALPTSESKFGNKRVDYIMNRVECQGTELNLGECPHETRQECNKLRAAGVYCLDPGTLQLTGGQNKFEGTVKLINKRVCVDRRREGYWNKFAAKVVCNQLFRTKFGRGGRGVPTFSHEFSSTHETRDDFYLSASCNGSELNFPACSFNILDKCPTSKFTFAGVKCAKCPPTDLVEIANGLEIEGASSAVIQSVESATEKLRTSCRDWTDCMAAVPEYPEFCKLRAFLYDAKVYLVPAVLKGNGIKIQLNLDQLKALRKTFLTQKFTDLSRDIDQLGGQLSGSLKGYFSDLAKHNQDIARLDVDYATNVWKECQENLEKRRIEMADQITSLGEFAGTVGSLGVLKYVAELIVKTISLFNPITIIRHPSILFDLVEAGEEIAKMTATQAGLAAVKSLVPKMTAITKRVRGRKLDNQVTFRKVKEIYEYAEQREEFTYADSKSILEGIDYLHPAIKAEDAKELVSTIDEILSKMCGMIDEAKGMSANMLTLMPVGRGDCQNARINLAIMGSLFREVRAQELDITDAYARGARARIVREGAEDISRTLSGDTSEKITRVIIKWKSLLLIRAEKAKILDHACNFLTYMNQGEKPKECVSIRNNPDSNVIDQVIGSPTHPMCQCPGCNKYTGLVRVPASFTKRGDGILDLFSLYQTVDGKTNGSAMFTIPNNQWLIDNKWMSEASNSPYFIKEFDLLAPPCENSGCTVKFTMSLLRNDINRKSYMFEPKTTIVHEYKENDKHCSVAEKSNAYYQNSCPLHLPKTCTKNNARVSNDLLPALVNSVWRVSLLSDVILPEPRAEGIIYFKAKVTYCFKDKGKDQAVVKVHNKHHNQHLAKRSERVCCSTQSKFYNFATATCEVCPAGSKPRMNDYFCQKCPAGYQPHANRHGFGCQQCPVGKFKAEPGDSPCTSCPANLHAPLRGMKECREVQNKT